MAGTIEVPLGLTNPLESELSVYEPERYYAVWQHPEGRYAYMIDEEGAGFLIVIDSAHGGEVYLAYDAHLNGRPISAYRLDELTLDEAFAAARAQAVPFPSSTGAQVERVIGVEVLNIGVNGFIRSERIPL